MSWVQQSASIIIDNHRLNNIITRMDKPIHKSTHNLRIKTLHQEGVIRSISSKNISLPRKRIQTMINNDHNNHNGNKKNSHNDNDHGNHNDNDSGHDHGNGNDPELTKEKKGKILLSPLKQYETKLKISSESWVTYNFSKMKYLRGWKPNKISEFNGLIRLILLHIYFQLAEEQPAFETIRVQVNVNLLKTASQQQNMSQKQLKSMKWLVSKPYHILSNNTMISLKDLIMGAILSSYEDLIEYAGMFLGYALHLKDTKSYEECLYIKNSKDAQKLTLKFMEGANMILKSKFSLKDTSVKSSFELESTPNEMAWLYIKILKNKRFLALMNQKQIIAQIKYEVGYKFYEDRRIRFANERPNFRGSRVVLNFRGKYNYGILCYSKEIDAVIVLEDCKFSMAEADLTRVEEWVMTVSKPIVNDSRTKHKNLINSPHLL